jgi:hypothetical protein
MENLFKNFATRVTAWRGEQPWCDWSKLPPGADREEKRLQFLEAHTRFQTEAERAAGIVDRAAKATRESALWRVQMERRGIPERVWPALRALQETRACAIVATWLSSNEWCRVLSGGTGTGKTTATACAVMTEKGRMVTATEFTDHLFDRPWLADLEDATLIAIDDLGTEKRDSEGYWLARWRALLDSRYRHNRRLVVTCNIPHDVFLATYVEGDGGRTRDRLRDGGGKFSTVEGESRRLVEGGGAT